MAPPRFHNLTISDVRRETADAVSLAFELPERLRGAYRYMPGQYLTLRATIDSEDVRRSYSICSGLDDGELRVVIKRLAGGAFSNWANELLRRGDTLSVMTPDGRFGVPIEPGSPRTLVAFAAGSGITPVMAILKSALRREAGRFFLFYGNRSTADIIFREALEDLKDRHLARLSVFHVLSREQQDLAVLNGHLDAAKVGDADAVGRAGGKRGSCIRLRPAADDRRAGDGARRHRYGARARACGAVHAGRRRPAAPGRGADDGAAEGDRHGDQRWRAVRLSVADGEAIIDAAIRAGRSLPYSCKGGMCCTCRAKLVEGKVEMAVNYSLEPWETEAGYVLTCQSRPVTERVVIDYDHV